MAFVAQAFRCLKPKLLGLLLLILVNIQRAEMRLKDCKGKEYDNKKTIILDTIDAALAARLTQLDDKYEGIYWEAIYDSSLEDMERVALFRELKTSDGKTVTANRDKFELECHEFMRDTEIKVIMRKQSKTEAEATKIYDANLPKATLTAWARSINAEMSTRIGHDASKGTCALKMEINIAYQWREGNAKSFRDAYVGVNEAKFEKACVDANFHWSATEEAKYRRFMVDAIRTAITANVNAAMQDKKPFSF